MKFIAAVIIDDYELRIVTLENDSIEMAKNAIETAYSTLENRHFRYTIKEYVEGIFKEQLIDYCHSTRNEKDKKYRIADGFMQDISGTISKKIRVFSTLAAAIEHANEKANSVHMYQYVYPYKVEKTWYAVVTYSEMNWWFDNDFDSIVYKNELDNDTSGVEE